MTRAWDERYKRELKSRLRKSKTVNLQKLIEFEEHVDELIEMTARDEHCSLAEATARIMERHPKIYETLSRATQLRIALEDEQRYQDSVPNG